MDRLCGVENRRIKEECGVFGMWLSPHLASKDIVRFALSQAINNQHRGEESAGMCISDGCCLWPPIKSMGHIKDLYKKYEVEYGRNGGIFGHIANVHNRYSTTGSSNIENAAPFRFEMEEAADSFAVSFNGNITNALELRTELSQNYKFSSTTDTEVIGALIAQTPGDCLEEKMIAACGRLEGAFSLVISTRDSLFGVRDGHGIKPLCAAVFEVEGQEGQDCFAISSETCALTKLKIKKIMEVRPGEIIRIKDGQLTSSFFSSSKEEDICGLEFAYLIRPDSHVKGGEGKWYQMEEIRRHLGAYLAEKNPPPRGIDYVTYIPESSKPAAEGFAEELGVPMRTGSLKSRYGDINGSMRWFINPNNVTRGQNARKNYFPFDWVAGQRIVLVDDSVIEGNTTKGVNKILKEEVGLLRNSGVAELHLRIIFPPVIAPCPYGVDIPETRFLVGEEFGSENWKQIAEYLGADSIAYLVPVEFSGGISEAVGRRVGLCMGCTTGNYPTAYIRARKDILETGK